MRSVCPRLQRPSFYDKRCFLLRATCQDSEVYIDAIKVLDALSRGCPVLLTSENEVMKMDLVAGLANLS